jgi:hypothetical protein
MCEGRDIGKPVFFLNGQEEVMAKTRPQDATKVLEGSGPIPPVDVDGPPDVG